VIWLINHLYIINTFLILNSFSQLLVVSEN